MSPEKSVHSPLFSGLVGLCSEGVHAGPLCSTLVSENPSQVLSDALQFLKSSAHHETLLDLKRVLCKHVLH